MTEETPICFWQYLGDCEGPLKPAVALDDEKEVYVCKKHSPRLFTFAMMTTDSVMEV